MTNRGCLIRTLLESHGHTHPFYAISKDDPEQIRALLAELTARADLQAIILNGGTGVSRRDNTFDAVAASLTKILPGFGEIFRMLSYQTIGSGRCFHAQRRALLSPPRQIRRHIVVFSIPDHPMRWTWQ